MKKISLQQKALVLFLGLAALLLPTAARAQAYDREAAESYNGGAFYELIAYDTYLDELANVLKAVELNRGSASITGGSITNDDFGPSPLGSGLGILIAAGASYALVRRKRSRKNTTLLLACVLLLGFTQCKKEQIELQGNGVNITLNVENGGASTGSATDGAKVNVDPYNSPMVTFGSGDQILVVSNGHYVGTLTHNGSNFSGEITDPTVGQPLYFYFVGNKNPEWATSGDDKVGCTVNISDQTTELPVISMAPSTESYSSTEDTYTASLHNKASLMKFNVTTPSNSPICITGMKNKVIIDFSKAANDGENNGFTYDKEDGGIVKLKGGKGNNVEKWAIVLPQDALTEGEAGTSFTFDGYKGSRPALDLIEVNKYYSTAVDLTVNTFDINYMPLTFEAKNAGATVAFTKGQYVQISVNNIEYSTDGGATWVEYSYGTGITLAKVGDRVSFRGNNSRYSSHSNESLAYKYSCSDDCYVYGNVMSLIQSNDFVNVYLFNWRIIALQHCVGFCLTST